MLIHVLALAVDPVTSNKKMTGVEVVELTATCGLARTLLRMREEGEKEGKSG